MASEELLDWSPAAGLAVPGRAGQGRPSQGLLAADSWLVADGRVRALERHRRRFVLACAEAGGVPAPAVSAFWDAMVDRLPRAGDWFPRAELVGWWPYARLRLRIRPAPARARHARVWVAGLQDPRRAPRRKGPDIERLGELRLLAQRAGADEALLTTRGGMLLEAAAASLLWWDGETLCLPSPRLRTLPGVTSGLIQTRAAELGLAVRRRRAQMSALASREVWLVNALHGIRRVSSWPGADLPAGEGRLEDTWRGWLDGLAEPLNESARP